MLKKYFRIVMKKYVSLIMIFVLPTYTITNYLLNSEEIMDKINSKATKIIFVHLFNTIKNKEESEYLIGTIVYIGFFPFLFYIKGFNEINFYLKCFKYLENKKVYKDNDINLKKIRNSSRKKSCCAIFIWRFRRDIWCCSLAVPVLAKPPISML